MRSFFLRFVLAWLLGEIFGVFRVASWFIIVVGLGILFLLLLGVRARVPILAAVIALAALGYVRAIRVPTSYECAVSDAAVGTIEQRLRVTEQSTTYIVSMPDGCRLVITVPPFPRYISGDAITLRGTFKNVAEQSSGYAAYLSRLGAAGTMSYPEVVRSAISGDSLPYIYEYWRRHIVTVFKEPDASFVLALFLAEQGTLPERMQAQFRMTGVNHILAISGFNISLMAGSFLVLFSWMPLPRAWRYGLLLALLWVYLWVIHFPVSAVRALWFWTLALVFHFHRSLISLPATVVLTTLIITGYSPALFMDIGFQLSMGAVIGIGWFWFLARERVEKLDRRWRGLFLLAATTIGATLMTGPLIAYHFGTVSLTGLPANILVVPLATITTLASLATLLVALLFPSVALLGTGVVHVCIGAMNVVTGFLAQWPQGYITDIAFSANLLVIYYVALACASVAYMKWMKRDWREIWA